MKKFTKEQKFWGIALVVLVLTFAGFIRSCSAGEFPHHTPTETVANIYPTKYQIVRDDTCDAASKAAATIDFTPGAKQFGAAITGCEGETGIAAGGAMTIDGNLYQFKITHQDDEDSLSLGGTWYFQ